MSDVALATTAEDRQCANLKQSLRSLQLFFANFAVTILPVFTANETDLLRNSEGNPISNFGQNPQMHVLNLPRLTYVPGYRIIQSYLSLSQSVYCRVIIDTSRYH